jgi:hypothetical protein
LIVGTIAGLVGCAGLSPSTTTPTSQLKAPTGQVLPPPAAEEDRHVQADLDQLDEATFESMIAQLPKSISLADAQRLLVKVDPSKVASGNVYSVQARGGGHGGHGGHMGGHHSFSHGHGHGHFHHHHRFNDFFFNDFSFFPFYNYYFPYYACGAAYYPYLYGGYAAGCPGAYGSYGAYPFLYGNPYSSLLSPYTFAPGTAPGAGLGMGGTMPGQQPQQQPQQPQQQPQPSASPTPGTMGAQTTGSMPMTAPY